MKGLLALAASGLALAAHSTSPPNVNVSSLPGPQSEPSIAIDPTNDRVLLAGSNSAAEPTTRAYGSSDGGATWVSTAAPPLPAGSGRSGAADPAVGIDRKGRQYFAFIRVKRSRGKLIGNLFVATRPGPDASWTTPSTPISSPAGSDRDDKPALAIDTTEGSPHEDRAYVAWVRRSSFSVQILLSSSDDGGATWSPPVMVNDDDTFAAYPSVAVARNGDVYVAWIELRQISIDRSTDGGSHFAADRRVAPILGNPFTSCTTLPAQPVNCPQANPIVSVDNSAGAFAGRVYVTYTQRGRNGVRDVFLAAFDPTLGPLLGHPVAGVAKQVNPADGRTRSDQFWPASAVDRSTGRLWVCYYDTTGDPRRIRAFFSCTASSDGGQTWARPVRAASVASNEAQPAANVRGYGDYEGLAVANGVAHPIWTDSRKLAALQEEIYTASLPDAAVSPPR